MGITITTFSRGKAVNTIHNSTVLDEPTLIRGGRHANKYVTGLLDSLGHLRPNHLVSFANLNNKKNIYWSNPYSGPLENNKLHLVCHDANQRKLFIFVIEETILRRQNEPTRQMKVNNNIYKTAFNIVIREVQTNTFLDLKSKINFTDFLKLTIEY